MTLTALNQLKKLTTIVADSSDLVNEEPIRKCDNGLNIWTTPEGIYYDQNNVSLPRGTIKLITGKDLTWEDEFIMIKDKL